MKQLAAIYLTLVIQQLFLFLPCYQLQQSHRNKSQQLQRVHDLSKRRRKSVVVEVSVASSDVLEQKRKEEHEEDDRNVEIVEELIEHFSTKHRGNVQLPPGWGKTEVALQTLREFYQLEEDKKLKEEGMESNKIVSAIYVTPNLKLADQVLDSLDRFDTFSGIPHQRLIVASQTGRADESCTTSVDEISAFLTSEGRSSKKSTSMRFIVSTYRSLPKVGEALKKMCGTINFGIFDEAHRMEGNGKLFGLGLFDENIPIDKRLFATATARNYIKSPRKVTVLGNKLRSDGSHGLIPKGRNKKNESNDERDVMPVADNVRSFLDESLFGQCVVKRTQRLEEVGVVWDVLSEKWENNYRLLVKFQQREGHCNVPRSHKEDRINLGTWLITQRQLKKKGELDSNLEERMEEVGVVWDLHSEKWEKNYQLLVNFLYREEHCNVPKSHKEDGMNLGHWLDRQRIGKRKGELDTSLEQRLEEMGVVWDVFSEQWGNNYRLLVKFQQREGHCNVPQSHTEDGMNLGVWLNNQRMRKRKGKLDTSLEQRLEEIGVVWDVLSVQREDSYRLLVKFQQREGHVNVPQNHCEDGINLGAWLKTQRKGKKKGKLDSNLEQRLEEMGVVRNFCF